MGFRFDGYRRLTIRVTVKRENASIRYVFPVAFQGATSSMPCEIPSPMAVAVSMTVVVICKPMPTCQNAKSVERGLSRFAATTTFK